MIRPKTGEPVLYEARAQVAVITMNRPEVENAQTTELLYALDQAFLRASMDDAIGAIVLRGNGRSFSAGHDPANDETRLVRSFPRVSMWPDQVGKSGLEAQYLYEEETFLGLIRRWREIPKPMIAMVHGRCTQAGLPVAWACDLVFASDDAYFADPALHLGITGIEFFAYPWHMGTRFAREFIFLGEQIDAHRALELGMVNRVLPLEDLERVTLAAAEQMASMPRFGLMLAKRALNFAEDAMGMRAGIDHSFALHQLSHAYAREVTGGKQGYLPHNERSRSVLRRKASR